MSNEDWREVAAYVDRQIAFIRELLGQAKIRKQSAKAEEKILPPDDAFKHPVCLAGANACPPEDCGGIGSYADLKEIVANPKHPEHQEMKMWLDGDFDPALFDLATVNLVLRQLKG